MLLGALEPKQSPAAGCWIVRISRLQQEELIVDHGLQSRRDFRAGMQSSCASHCVLGALEDSAFFPDGSSTRCHEKARCGWSGATVWSSPGKAGKSCSRKHLERYCVAKAFRAGLNSDSGQKSFQLTRGQPAECTALYGRRINQDC